MATASSSASDIVPRRTPEVWAFAAVAALAGALVAAFYCGLIGPARPAGGGTLKLLSLKSVFDPAWMSSKIGSLFGSALGSPFVMVLGVAIASALLALVCDAVLRRVFLASKPGAAGLAAIAILLAPGWGTALRIEGHGGIIAGAPFALLGCLLALERRGSAIWIAAALMVAAADLHPAWVVALPVLLAAFPRRTSLGALAVAVVLVALDLSPHQQWKRLGFALRDLAAAPVLAFSPWRRFDVPTGYEQLVSNAPVVLGLAIQALVLGVGMMIGGIRAGLITACGATLSVLATALAIHGYVPGDRAFVLPAMMAYAPLVALILGTVPARIAKAALPGVILGAGVVAVLIAKDRAPSLTTLGAAIDLPREKNLAGQVISIRSEKDPARLVLFLTELGLTDAYSPALVEAADKLIDGGAPALDSGRLKAILDQMMGRAGRKRTDPAFERLVQDVERELAIADRLFSQSPAVHFPAIADALVGVHTKVLDLWFNWRHEFATIKALETFRRLAQRVIPAASRGAYYEYSIPLLEALQVLGPETPDAAGMIALQKFLSGDPDGLAELQTMLPRLPPKGSFAALVRGLIGIGLLGKGDSAAALRELQASWTGLGQGGVKSVTNLFPPDTADYSLVGEILLARFEAAKAVDPQLAVQASKDLEDLFKPLLSFGPRRVPPLAIMGRLHLLLGRKEQALALLREARLVPHATMDDRSDGPVGRIAQPRLRRFALENLILALGEDPSNLVERGEVAEELRQLSGK